MERQWDLFSITFDGLKRGAMPIGFVADRAYTHLKPIVREFIDREVITRSLEKFRVMKSKSRYGRRMR